MKFLSPFFKKLLAVLLGGAVLAPAFALAQVNAGVDAAVTSAPASASADASASAGVQAPISGATSAQATVYTRAKTKADQEIQRRITALNALVARIGQMDKVTDALKQTLTVNTQAQITSLTQLQAKIDADTDASTLKDDVKSITSSYRVYMLAVPQARIAAAADRMATIINMFIADGGKLQARIQSAQSAGADVSALAAALNDLGAQLSTAQAHAQAAVNETATLQPDNGDNTLQASNTAALKQGKSDLDAGHTALVAARKDLQTIIDGLKKVQVSASSSSSVQTQ